ACATRAASTSAGTGSPAACAAALAPPPTLAPPAFAAFAFAALAFAAFAFAALALAALALASAFAFVALAFAFAALAFASTFALVAPALSFAVAGAPASTSASVAPACDAGAPPCVSACASSACARASLSSAASPALGAMIFFPGAVGSSGGTFHPGAVRSIVAALSGTPWSRASPGHSASACFSIASSPRTLVSWRAVSAFTASNSRRARPAAASATNGITSATTNAPSPRSPMTLYRIRSSMPAAPDGERRSYTPPRPGTTSPLGVTCPSVNLLVGGGLAQRALGFAQRGGLALGRLRREVDLLQQPALAVVVDVRVVRALVAERGEALGELPLLGRFAIVDAPQILRPADDVGREH